MSNFCLQQGQGRKALATPLLKQYLEITCRLNFSKFHVRLDVIVDLYFAYTAGDRNSVKDKSKV